MTRKEKLVTAREGADTEEIRELLHRYRIEKVLLINDRFELCGLITVKDIDKARMYPNACKDSLGRLRVGASVGTSADTDDRVAALVEAGVDVLVVDTVARPFETRARSRQLDQAEVSERVVDRRQRRDASRCARAGRRGRRLGQGRDRSRQHLHDAHRDRHRRAAGHRGVRRRRRTRATIGFPVVADGGIRYSGDIAKALVAGRQRRDDRWFARRHRRVAGRDRAVSRAHVQVVSRHGVARRDGTGERLERSLLPGTRQRRRPQAGARRHRRPRAVSRCDGRRSCIS